MKNAAFDVKKLQQNIDTEVQFRSVSLDFDRLRSAEGTIERRIEDLATRIDALPPGDALRKQLVTEFKALVSMVSPGFKGLNETHNAWLTSSSGAQVWTPAAVAKAEVSYDVGMRLRRDVLQRVPDVEERFVAARKSVGIGEQINKGNPGEVLDLLVRQHAAVSPAEGSETNETLVVLELFGVDAEPHRLAIGREVAELDPLVRKGVGDKRGEARARRDLAQKRLEAILGRIAVKVGTLLGDATKSAFESLLPRPYGRRVEDTPATDETPVAPVNPAAPVTPDAPEAEPIVRAG